MVAEREMPAWQWTNTLPPASLMESGKQSYGLLKNSGEQLSPHQRRLRNVMCDLSRDGQGQPHAIMQTTCVYCAKDSKGFKPRLGICTYHPQLLESQ